MQENTRVLDRTSSQAQCARGIEKWAGGAVETIVINLRVPDTEVTRLRHLGEEEAEEDVERQLIMLGLAAGAFARGGAARSLG